MLIDQLGLLRLSPSSGAEIDDDNSSVLRGKGVLWKGRLGRAFADGLKPVGRDAHLADQKILHCVGAAL
jgi:hypothetical protein